MKTRLMSTLSVVGVLALIELVTCSVAPKNDIELLFGGKPFGYRAINRAGPFRTPRGSGLRSALLFLGYRSEWEDIERAAIQAHLHLQPPFEIIVLAQPGFKEFIQDRWGDRLEFNVVGELTDSNDEGEINKLHTRKYKLWRNFLSKHSRRYESVLMGLASELWIQGDPFPLIPKDKVVFPTEIRKRIGADETNRIGIKIVDQSIRSQYFDMVKNERIISAGATMGSVKSVIEYLDDMVKIFVDVHQKSPELLDIGSMDQAFHNILLHTNVRWKEGDASLILDSFESPVFPVGIGKEADFAVDLVGNVHHKNGKPPIVLHFNRHARLSLLSKKWSELFLQTNVFNGTSGFVRNLMDRILPVSEDAIATQVVTESVLPSDEAIQPQAEN